MDVLQKGVRKIFIIQLTEGVNGYIISSTFTEKDCLKPQNYRKAYINYNDKR